MRYRGNGRTRKTCISDQEAVRLTAYLNWHLIISGDERLIYDDTSDNKRRIRIAKRIGHIKRGKSPERFMRSGCTDLRYIHGLDMDLNM